ncbi:hypothetical protein Btru_016189 [Bulinus truncatus]|nr:hypothetical protein Btru_016189 [Bulinus truncatus]
MAPLPGQIVITWFCVLILEKADGANYLGREFILHFPCMSITEPMLNIYTLLDQAVRVFITIPLENENVRKQVTVQKSTVANFPIKKSYLTWQWDFVQKPIVLDGKYQFGVMVETETGIVADNFLALPVENYGTVYYLLALDHQALTVWECQGYTVNTMKLKSEMLFPEESFGTEFVIANVQKMNASSENIHVLLLSPETRVIVRAGGFEKYYSLGENATNQRLLKIKEADDYCTLTSNQKVAVFYVIYQSCTTGRGGLIGVVIALVIKSDLFYNKYVWR